MMSYKNIEIREFFEFPRFTVSRILYFFLILLFSTVVLL